MYIDHLAMIDLGDDLRGMLLLQDHLALSLGQRCFPRVFAVPELSAHGVHFLHQFCGTILSMPSFLCFLARGRVFLVHSCFYPWARMTVISLHDTIGNQSRIIL